MKMSPPADWLPPQVPYLAERRFRAPDWFEREAHAAHEAEMERRWADRSRWAEIRRRLREIAGR